MLSLSSKSILVYNQKHKQICNVYLSLLGNGIIGMSLSGNRYLYISDGESLSIRVLYESLLIFTVDQRHSQRGNKFQPRLSPSSLIISKQSSFSCFFSCVHVLNDFLYIPFCNESLCIHSKEK